MSNELYYVEFDGTPAKGQGPVTQSDHSKWFKMDTVTGGETYRSVENAQVGVGNQTDRNPIHIGDINMCSEKCSAASYLHQMHFNASVIPKITVHRMRSQDKKLVIDEEIVLENARIKSFTNHNDFTDVTFSGFSTYQKSYYVYDDKGKPTTQRVGYNLAEGDEMK